MDLNQPLSLKRPRDPDENQLQLSSKKSCTEKISLDSLPEDLIVLIFNELGKELNFNLTRTCLSFKAIIEKYPAYKIYLRGFQALNHSFKIIKKMPNTPKNIKLKFDMLCNLAKSHTCTNSKMAWQITHSLEFFYPQKFEEISFVQADIANQLALFDEKNAFFAGKSILERMKINSSHDLLLDFLNSNPVLALQTVTAFCNDNDYSFNDASFFDPIISGLIKYYPEETLMLYRSLCEKQNIIDDENLTYMYKNIIRELKNWVPKNKDNALQALKFISNHLKRMCKESCEEEIVHSLQKIYLKVIKIISSWDYDTALQLEQDDIGHGIDNNGFLSALILIENIRNNQDINDAIGTLICNQDILVKSHITKNVIVMLYIDLLLTKIRSEMEVNQKYTASEILKSLKKLKTFNAEHKNIILNCASQIAPIDMSIAMQIINLHRLFFDKMKCLVVIAAQLPEASKEELFSFFSKQIQEEIKNNNHLESLIFRLYQSCHTQKNGDLLNSFVKYISEIDDRFVMNAYCLAFRELSGLSDEIINEKIAGLKENGKLSHKENCLLLARSLRKYYPHMTLNILESLKESVSADQSISEVTRSKILNQIAKIYLPL